MTIHSINLDTSAQIVADIAYDVWLVKTGVEVTTNGTAIAGSNSAGYKSFLIYGSLIADNGSGIEVGLDTAESGRNAVSVYAGASIFGEVFGVYSDTEALSLYNEGSIQSQASSGVVGHGGSAAVTNLGTIASQTGVGVGFSGAGNHLVNSGTISGGSHGAYVDGTCRILNTGTLTGVASGVMLIGNNSVLSNGGAIFADTAGVVIDGTGNAIDNSGTIEAAYDDPGGTNGAIRFFTSTGDLNRLVNTGEIHGADLAVQGLAGNETVINRGLIDGAIDLGAGNDLYDGRGGEVIGPVRGGAGNDTYRVDNADTALVELAAGGTDSIESTVSFRLAAEFENLLLLGTLDISGTGNAQANTLTGNLGSNRLAGGNGTDVMSGSDGSDQLFGGNGNDTLQGDDGEDDLIGGAGRDALAGGADGDRFVFKAIADSTVANSDRIADFVSGEDVIDLSAIDARAGSNLNNAFTFIGTAAFSGLAGELRFEAGTESYVEGDTTGDGVADFAIRFTNGAVVTALDIVL